MTEHAVYVIQAEGGSIKIGHSMNPVKRLGNLQASNPERLEVKHAVWVPTQDAAFAIEQACHYRLQQNKINGEWFDVALDVAIETVNKEHENYATNLTRGPLYEKSAVKRMPRVDWAECEKLFMAGVSLRNIACQPCADGASFKTIHKHAKTRGWKRDVGLGEENASAIINGVVRKERCIGGSPSGYDDKMKGVLVSLCTEIKFSQMPIEEKVIAIREFTDLYSKLLDAA